MREKNILELEKKVEESREHLFRLRFKKRLGSLDRCDLFRKERKKKARCFSRLVQIIKRGGDNA